MGATGGLLVSVLVEVLITVVVVLVVVVVDPLTHFPPTRINPRAAGHDLHATPPSL